MNNEHTPKISVIIPTLNAARTLKRCLESIKAQDYPDESLEIVIADAGSTDATMDILKRFNITNIVSNPLKTGEAGKTAGIIASSGELIALVDSDNIFADRQYFRKVADIMSDKSIYSAEPMEWDIVPGDTVINRYCALLGMNDPVSYFLGNYNRLSHLSGKFMEMKPLSMEKRENAYIVDINPKEVPTFGANGFIVRRDILEKLDWQPYYFDIDVFQQMVNAGFNRIAVIKTGIHHLYCDKISTFARKQSRRIRDYFYHSKNRRRSYDYGAVPKWKYLWFIIATLTIFPLLLQTIKGFIKKPDTAWWFHPAACWITLWQYSFGTLSSIVSPGEYKRERWKQ